MKTLISQQLNAGNNFSGAAPDGGSKTEEGSRIEHYDLTAGGEFDFGYNVPLKGLRILLDLGDATDWTLEIRSKDGSGTTHDFVVYEFADFGTNKVNIHGQAVLQLDKGETLRLTTTGASSSLFASVMVSR